MQPRKPPSFLPFLLLVASAACGGAADDSSRWVGQTFLLDIPPANWSEPRGIGSDIGGFVPQFLFGVARGTGQDLTITIGTAGGGVQDPCNPTTQVIASGANYPGMQIVVPAFPLHIVDKNQKPTVVVNTTVRDFSFRNTLPGGTGKEGDVSATIDAAEVYPLFRLIPNPTKESVCQALASAGAACTPCSHNGQPFCLTIKAVQLAGTPAAAAIKPAAANEIPPSCKTP